MVAAAVEVVACGGGSVVCSGENAVRLVNALDAPEAPPLLAADGKLHLEPASAGNGVDVTCSEELGKY